MDHGDKPAIRARLLTVTGSLTGAKIRLVDHVVEKPASTTGVSLMAEKVAALKV
jgi:hypothetical protein